MKIFLLILVGTFLVLGLALLRQKNTTPPPPDPSTETCEERGDCPLPGGDACNPFKTGLVSCGNPGQVDSCQSGAAKDCKNVCTASDGSNYLRPDGTPLPPGNFCLPPITQRKCNLFTSRYVLGQGANGSLQWVCQCKHPQLFDHSTDGASDCLFEKACSATSGGGNLGCPPTGTTGATAESCPPNELWKDHQNWDPSAGVCHCNAAQGWRLGSNNYTCVKETCSPGVYNNSSKTCDCPQSADNPSGNPDNYKIGDTTYLSCPTDLSNPQDPASDLIAGRVCDKDHPSCIPDTCNPGGMWDPSKMKCKCQYPYAEKANDTGIGSECVKLCEGKNNPCPVGSKCEIDITDPLIPRMICSGCPPGLANHGNGGDPCGRCGKAAQQWDEHCDERAQDCGDGMKCNYKYLGGTVCRSGDPAPYPPVINAAQCCDPNVNTRSLPEWCSDWNVKYPPPKKAVRLTNLPRLLYQPLY